MKEKLIIEVLNPRGEVEIISHQSAPRISGLKGKTIGLIDNKKAGARPFLNYIRVLLEKEFPDIQFINLSKNFNEQHRMKKYMNQLQGIDAAVYSTGD